MVTRRVVVDLYRALSLFLFANSVNSRISEDHLKWPSCPSCYIYYRARVRVVRIHFTTYRPSNHLN